MTRSPVTRWRLRRARRRNTPEQRIALDTQMALAEIRSTFALFGYDLGHLTDEEIEQVVCRVAQAMAASRVSAEDAARGLSQLAQAAGA